MIASAWVVYLKELKDALRDRRTLFMVLLSSVAIGPLVLVAISQLVAGIEKRAEAREVYAVGIEHAPALRNFLERQTYTVKARARRLGAAAARQQVRPPPCWWCRPISRPSWRVARCRWWHWWPAPPTSARRAAAAA